MHNLNHKVTNKPILKGILQNKWPAVFKNIKVIKVKERLGNCTLVKKIKEVLQLNVMGDFELDSKRCVQVAQLPKPEWGTVVIS